MYVCMYMHLFSLVYHKHPTSITFIYIHADVAWQAVVGMAAIAKNAPNLECVDFSGCFRLNKSLKSSLSQMKCLLKLNLMGCSQASDMSLMGVAKGCTLLEELCLSDCVKGVTGLSMDAFGTYCLNLRIIVLARCHNLDGKGISGIAKCSRLEKLDISSCSGLTDMRYTYLRVYIHRYIHTYIHTSFCFAYILFVNAWNL